MNLENQLTLFDLLHFLHFFSHKAINFDIEI